MSTDLAVVSDDQIVAAIEREVGLRAGSIQKNGLHLTDANMEFADWQRLGVGLGNMARWSIWALGDWLLFGEAVYGEDAYQAVEGNVFDRYDLASRVTGLREETLRNYATLASRVAHPRRRPELHPSTHMPVTKLEPDEQEKWLQKAIDHGWGREQLGRAVKGLDPDPPPKTQQVVGGGHDRLSHEDQLEAAARNVWGLASATGDGGYLVPGEAMAQLRAALGETDEP